MPTRRASLFVASGMAYPSSRRATLAAPRLVDPFLWAMAAAALGVLAAALVGGARDFASYRALDAPRWLLLATLMVASHLVLTHLILFDWRGQRVALGPDEVLVFLALAALPPSAVVVFAVPTMALYQVRTRRPFLRAAGNVAFVALASAACAAAFVLLEPRLPRLLALIGAITVYTTTTHLLVSTVFALREDAPVLTVFGERFLVPTLLHITLGVSGGIAIIALWEFHPAALAALVPFVWLAKEHVGLVARGEREMLVHDRVADTMRALVGERDLDVVAARVLESCGELFQAGRAALVVRDADRELRWARDFEGGASEERPITAPIPDRDGAPVGTLVVHANRRANQALGATDLRLLGIVAGEAAGALANARALRDLDAARARLETVLATATDTVLLVGTDGVVRYANPAGARLLGLREGTETAARTLFEDVQFLVDAAHAGEPRLYETWARAPDRRFPIEVSAARLRDDPTLVLAIVRDATQRKVAEEALLSQRVARPLVRRIVRGLMVETRTDSLVLMRIGQQLAAGVEGREIEAFTRAYAEMGLGTLRAISTEGPRLEFVGEKLMEQTEGARSTTCYLALGFLCGAVGHAHAHPARGAEVECVSRGDPRCRFVVSVRDDAKP